VEESAVIRSDLDCLLALAGLRLSVPQNWLSFH